MSVDVAKRQSPFDLYVLPEIDVLFRVARSLTHNTADAEDLVQETLIRAHRAVDHFDGRYPRAWLLTIMRNANINGHRRRRPELLRDPDSTFDRMAEAAGDEVTDSFVELEFDIEITRALAALSGPFRLVVELIDIQGLSYAEAAGILDIPAGTVMSRLHRARARMRDRLDRAGLAPRSAK